MFLTNEQKIELFRCLDGNQPKGQSIAITGVKGGSGRSLVSICLAVALAESGLPVLVLDCSSHFPAANLAIEKRLTRPGSSLPIMTAMALSLGDLENLTLPFSPDKGYVIFDLPPIRSHLHLLGLAMADQILFCTRSDNELRMWEERTRDMVVIARNLEVPSEEVGSFPRKPCWCVMTDFQPNKRSVLLRSALQSDPVLTWLGEMVQNERFAGWIADGVAPWERSRTDLAQKWKHLWDPILNYQPQY